MNEVPVTPFIKRELFKALKDDLETALKNIALGKFKLYRNNDVIILVEFNTLIKDLHIVALTGTNSIPTINGIYNYARSKGYNLYFQTNKKSIIRLFKRYNPLIVGKDKDLYQIRVYTNG